MNVRESLSVMDEAMLVRGLKGKLRQSKSCENLVALGLFDDIAMELTVDGKKVAKEIAKEQKEKAKNGLQQKVYTEFVLNEEACEVERDGGDMFDEDGSDEDWDGFSSFSPQPF